MEPPDDKSSGGAEVTPAPARKLGLRNAVLFIAILVVVLVPAAFVPATADSFDSLTVFYTSKFQVLRVLSVLLLGAVLLDRDPRLVPVLIPALAFLGVSILSALFSGSFADSLVGDRYDGLLSLAAGVALFYATARFLDSWTRVRTLLAAGVATAVLISAYGILQSFRLDPVLGRITDWPEGERVFSTLGQPIHLAAYLTLMIGAALALYFLTERRFARVLCLAALALMGACWLYTYTRGAMLGVAVALPVVLWLAHRRLGTARPLLLPLAVLAVAMFAAQLSSPQATSVFDLFQNVRLAHAYVESPQGGDAAEVATLRLLSIRSANGAVVAQAPPAEEKEKVPAEGSSTEEPPVTNEASLREVSTLTRLWIWRDTIPMILDRPLLGHGPDNYLRSFDDYQGEDLRTFSEQSERYIDKAHNEFLQVAATTGLLGLAAYLWIFVSYFRNVYRRGGWVLLALSGGVLAYILQLQTNFTTIANGVTFWVILGVSVAVMRLLDRQEEAALLAPGPESGDPGTSS